MTFPEKIKKMRKASGLTQAFVAKELGITRQAYAAYESGKNTPRAENLVLLASLFYVSIDALLASDESVSVAVLPEPITRILSDEISKLNYRGKTEALKRVRELTRLSEYTDKSDEDRFA